MKDRIALNIIRDAEKKGLLGPAGVIIEATSGNTGAGLAMVAALTRLSVHLCHARQDVDGKGRKPALARRQSGAVSNGGRCRRSAQLLLEVTKRLVAETPERLPRQPVPQPGQPRGSLPVDGPRDLGADAGEIDTFVAGMGTGGTISGCGSTSKSRTQRFKIVGVDPIGSIYYELKKTGRITKPFSYSVEGIGEDFVPSTMNLALVDEIIRVDDKDCFLLTRALVQKEGVMCGGSAVQPSWARFVTPSSSIAQGLPHRRTSWCCCPIARRSICRRSSTTTGCATTASWTPKIRSALVSRHLCPARLDRSSRPRRATLRQVISLLKEHGISQVPVLDRGRLCGIVAEVDLLNHIAGQGRAPSIETIEHDHRSRLSDGDAADQGATAQDHL
jgi:cystathionine beta-synthase